MKPILFQRCVCVLDTETTGFADRDWSRVIELAGVILDIHGDEIAAWESLVLPDILDERAAGALAVNHIDPDQVRAIGMPTAEAVAAFAAFLAEHECAWVTSFNAAFDRPMVERMGLSLAWAPCVMEDACEIMGPLGLLRPAKYGRKWLWPKLSHAAEHFAVPVVGLAHRALTDARTAAGIACAIGRLNPLPF